MTRLKEVIFSDSNKLTNLLDFDFVGLNVKAL